MSVNDYGFFNEKGDSFIITNPATPRPFDNFLFNDACYSNVHQTGIGCMDYQINATEGIQLFTGVGRICDYDVFGKEHLYSRLIYIRDDDTGEFWNLNWEPVCHPYEAYKCVHSMGYTEITNVTNSTEGKFFIGVPNGNDPIECWSVSLKNLADSTRNYSVFVYNQLQFRFKWGFDSYGDMVYRSTEFCEKENTFFAEKHPAVRPHNWLTAFLAADKKIAGYDGSYSHFMGEYGTVVKPRAVSEGTCFNSVSSADSTIAAIQFKITLKAGESDTFNMVLGVSDSQDACIKLRDKYLNAGLENWKALCDKSKELLEVNSINTPDSHLNRMVNYWAKKATVYGATWCRWGYNGFRDIVQHGMGVSAFMPQRTKQIIIEAMKHQYSDGSAVRGWNPIDRKPYSDSALWLEFTFNAYIKETGDIDFLNQIVPYFDEGEGTVLEHINKALDFLEMHKGSHNLLLIKFGDWNDSLTQVGKEGKGESVWLSMAYVKALQDMSELSEFIGEKEKAENYTKRLTNIKQAINDNAWDGEWYCRCFDDNGDPLGSHKNKCAEIFIEPQSWALLAGVADVSRREILLNATERILGTSVGYRLLAPSFREYDPRVGRISAMEPGVAENSTVYTHTNIWMVAGMLKNGMPNEAYKLFCKNTPGYENTENTEIKSKTLPYQYANCYFGPEHKNNAYQMEFTWITGSTAWISRTIEIDMLGIRPDFDGLHICPCVTEFEEYTVNRNFRNADYKITVKNPKKLKGSGVSIIADGVSLSGDLLPTYSDGKLHIIECTVLE